MKLCVINFASLRVRNFTSLRVCNFVFLTSLCFVYSLEEASLHAVYMLCAMCSKLLGKMRSRRW